MARPRISSADAANKFLEDAKAGFSRRACLIASRTRQCMAAPSAMPPVSIDGRSCLPPAPHCGPRTPSSRMVRADLEVERMMRRSSRRGSRMLSGGSSLLNRSTVPCSQNRRRRVTSHRRRDGTLRAGDAEEPTVLPAVLPVPGCCVEEIDRGREICGEGREGGSRLSCAALRCLMIWLRCLRARAALLGGSKRTWVNLLRCSPRSDRSISE